MISFSESAEGSTLLAYPHSRILNHEKRQYNVAVLMVCCIAILPTLVQETRYIMVDLRMLFKTLPPSWQIFPDCRSAPTHSHQDVPCVARRAIAVSFAFDNWGHCRLHRHSSRFFLLNAGRNPRYHFVGVRFRIAGLYIEKSRGRQSRGMQCFVRDRCVLVSQCRSWSCVMWIHSRGDFGSREISLT